MSDRYDVVIVGGGTAGCAAASRLVQGGRRVLLLEAGPDYGARSLGAWPADLLRPNLIPTSHDLGYTSLGPAGQTIDQPRAAVIGGCSAHNHCGVVWASPGAWDRWSEPTGGTWDAASMTPYLDRAAQTFRTAPTSEADLRPLGRTFLGTVEAELGVPVVRDGGLCGRSAGPFQFNIDDGARFNAAFAYLDPLRGRDELAVVGGAHVERIDVVDGRVTHVAYTRQGVQEVVEAEIVLLCAGAYDTPALLMRSGVGDRELLRAAGVEAVVDLPAVGATLRDHPAVALFFSASDELEAANDRVDSPDWMPGWQTFLKERSSRCSELDLDLHLYPTEVVDERGHTVVIVGVSCMAPRSTGSVRIAEHDGGPVIDHAYLSDDDGHDLAVIAEGVALARRLFATGPLARLVGAELRPAPAKPAAFARWARANVAHYFHPAGTVPMGRSPRHGAVSPEGLVFGLDNVYLGDASIMPSLPNANTNLAVAAVAERIADGLVRRSGAALARPAGR